VKIVVIGSGGREHALIWKLSENKAVSELIAVPGNGGTASIARNLVPASNATMELVDEIKRQKPDLVVVGPEQPLADGITNLLEKANILSFGPSARAARIESSKVFSKELMRKHAIPTAEFEVFDDFEMLEDYVREHPRPNGRVVKADGLAAGKGAFVCENDHEAVAVSRKLLKEGALGEAGRRVVVEEKLIGTEASAHYWCDGKRFAPLPVARDYKCALDGDRGPNTGGMGTLCPARHVTAEILEVVSRTIVSPTLLAMADEGCPYRGVLYVGLMLTESGPQVIEYNCRFGDPETQVMLPVLEGDIVETMLACAQGKLIPQSAASASEGASVCVVLAAEGYPGSYLKGIELKSIRNTSEFLTFHAGTTIKEDHLLISSGGRVLNAVGRGSTIEAARSNAYLLANQLLVPGLRFRSDIAANTLFQL
jgi:phosphoribosylamine---glycine ligase